MDKVKDLNKDLLIIGGGASGMTAAIVSKRINPNLRVCILEKNRELGKKILATGNGRCNIANKKAEGFSEVENFLNSCHIVLTEEQKDWMYPKSREASSVVKLLEAELNNLGVEVICNCEVEQVEKLEKVGFRVVSRRKADICNPREKRRQKFPIPCSGESIKLEIFAHRLLIAAGGKAAPQFGTAGSGTALGRQLGHSITKLSPVLTPLLCENPYGAAAGATEALGTADSVGGSVGSAGGSVGSAGSAPAAAPAAPGAVGMGRLKGVRTPAQLSLWRGQGFVASQLGELQFTADGISGICILNLSRHIDVNAPSEAEFRKYSITADFIPNIREDELIEELFHRKVSMSGYPAHLLTESIINSKLGRVMLESVSSAEEIWQITDDEIRSLANLIKNSRFTVLGAKGWREAQCTGGGVELSRVNQDTMESTQVEGLFFAGEVLNYDGDCGGFNLNHAWYTGLKAGKAMVADL